MITTNNVDKLDPALTRPGRITFKINLREMTRKNAHELINYHFPDEILDEKFDIITDFSLTPAKMESFCKQADTINDLHILLKEYYNLV